MTVVRLVAGLSLNFIISDLKVTVNPIPGAFVRKLRLPIWRRICRGESTWKNSILFQQITTGTKHFRVTQSSVIRGDSEGIKTVSEFSFVCLEGKKLAVSFIYSDR